MKLLITGLPKSGKSTLISNLIKSDISAWGFLTNQLITNGLRSGFETISSNGDKCLLAQSNKLTCFQVSKFYVNVAEFDKFIIKLVGFNKTQLIYIDEIGQMQLSSVEFRKILLKCLESENDFISTLTSVFTNEYIDLIKNMNDIIFLQLNSNNYNDIERCVTAMIANRATLKQLDHKSQKFVHILSKHYLENNSYDSLFKLYANAIRYVNENRVDKIDNSFQVRGDNDTHIISVSELGNYKCDCPLYLGLKPFLTSGDCSHIQAIKILNIK